MWVRKLGAKGNAEAVSLPSEALEALGWERGDHIVVTMVSPTALRLTKFDGVRASDRALRALEPLKSIYA